MAQKIGKIAILGFGREGKSVLEFIKKSPGYCGAEIWILDKNERIKTPLGAKARLGKNYLKNLADFDLVFRSPGIPYNLPELKNARQKGTKFSSLTRLFMENCPAKIIGITGSKGKTTTSTILYRILKAGGRKVFLAGNIGTAALSILNKVDKNSLVILELSSFQLQDLDISPHIAAVLDVFPEHQDHHRSLKEYYDAKANIAKHQSADRRTGDKIFFFSSGEESPPSPGYGRAGALGGKNNNLSRSIALKSAALKMPANENNFDLFRPADLKIPGAHNFKNALMAATIALALGAPPQTIRRAVRNFRGVPHRLELVRKIKLPNIPRIITNDSRIAKKQTGGIRAEFGRKNSGGKIREIIFYNDSASTNPQTTAAAIKAFPSENKIIIAGGQDKGLDYKPLADALKSAGRSIKLVILFGENKRKIAKAIKRIANNELRITEVDDLTRAVALAYEFAKKSIIHNSSFIILFSPGAASFDMFKNYADRGEKFKQIVKKL